jgi:hypothetical protein
MGYARISSKNKSIKSINDVGDVPAKAVLHLTLFLFGAGQLFDREAYLWLLSIAVRYFTDEAKYRTSS